jgi:hypothetical protein
MGDFFTLGSFLKITEEAQLFELLFLTAKVKYLFFQKWVGLHFGQFYYRLEWSPD